MNETEPPESTDIPAAPDPTDTVIGRFRLLEKIGEGGFGVVYVAEQKTPVRRRVALKILKLGMDTRSVVARFEAERQALAMMDHPNIAKVLDAGATDTGRPYFVMELVRGIPITQYCDQNNLSPAQRLDLFVSVCHAIQHAHQKGIIHRDIKPSNILVTLHDGIPLPKVIDFGIAKATQGDLTDKTLYTQFQQFIGTPAYMSPEQAEMSALDVDTRSDIYSLGVLLYELLTGTTPFDAKELLDAGMDEMRRRIRETDPQRPSNRLSGMTNADSTRTAKHLGMDAPRLISLLRGDLDWVVMKCLEKDRTRRYETANGLAVDIKRHLNNEPIFARPPSRTYRFQKSIRRNKLTYSAAAAIFLAILLGLVLAVAGFQRASIDRNRAIAALAEAERQRSLADENFRAARGAVEDVLQIASDTLSDQPGAQPLQGQLMKAAIDRYEPFLTRPSDDPTPRAELAKLYAQYGLHMLQQTEVFDERVMAMFEKARTIQTHLVEQHPRDRAIRMDLGWTLILESWRKHSMPPRAEDAGRQAIAHFRQLVAEDPRDPFARNDLVWALWRTSTMLPATSHDEALALAAEGMATGRQLVSEYPASAEFRRELGNAIDMHLGFRLNGQATPQDIRNAMPEIQSALDLKEASFADLQADRPEARQPARPSGAAARMVRPSLLWAKWDVALSAHRTAEYFRVLQDWRRSAELDERSATLLMDMVTHSPSVATFYDRLHASFAGRLRSAHGQNDREHIAAWSKQPVEFWTRLTDAHPDLPILHNWADKASAQAAEADAWLAKTPTPP